MRGLTGQRLKKAVLFAASGLLGLSALLAAVQRDREVSVKTSPGNVVVVHAEAPVPRAIRAIRALDGTSAIALAKAQTEGPGTVRLVADIPMARIRLVAAGAGMVPMEIPALGDDPVGPLVMQRSARLDLGPLEGLAEGVAVYARVRPAAPPADCRPRWRSQERDLALTRGDLVASLASLPEDSVSAFVPELGEVFLRPAETVREFVTPVKRIVRFLRLQPGSGEPAVLLFGRSEIAVAQLDGRSEAVVSAPPGEWRLKIISSSGQGAWRGDVETPGGAPIEVTEEEPVRVQLQAVDARGEDVPSFDAWPFLGASQRARNGPPGAPLSVVLWPGDEPVLFCLSAPGFETGSVLVRAKDASSVVKVRLKDRPRPPEEIRWVTGKAVGADGQPLPQMRIVIVPVGSDEARVLSGRLSEATRAVSTAADERGEFRLGPLVGPGAFEIYAMGEGVAARRLRTLELGDRDPGELDLGALEVPAAREVAGRVIEAGSGRAVAGARVMVVVMQTEKAWSGLRRDPVETDAEGRFSLRDLPQGRALRLMVEAPGYVPAGALLGSESAASDAMIEVKVESGASIHGRTTTSSGGGIEGVEVSARVSGRWRARDGLPMAQWLDTRSGAEGVFVLAGLPCDAGAGVVLSARASGWASRIVELPPLSCGGDSPSIDIVLSHSVPWRGRVLREGTGQPVAGAIVLVGGKGTGTRPDGSFLVELSELGEIAGRVRLADGLEVPFSVTATDVDGLQRDLFVP